MTRLLVLFVTAFVDMVGLTMIIPLLPFYATELGASATVVGLLVSAFAVAQLAVAPVWGRFSDRYGRRPAILAGLLLTGSAYVIFAFAGSVLVLLLSRLVQGAGGGTIGVVQAYVADASPPEERTKSLGWLSAVTSLGADCIIKTLRDEHKAELFEKLKGAGVDGQVDVSDFKRYGSARTLYHFHIDNASSY